MFKKLKDKLAEEVKSSPQRIQQFAQAAQAAVTSASSSISDITNSDLFSIGDNDNPQSRSVKNQSSANVQSNTFQDASHIKPDMDPETMDFSSSHDIVESQRQRRLSNSSFASDVSFRLPSYETPSMYHLQSDMEVSASEAEERGFSSGSVSLDRVTKEQIYSAYKRTQDRYKKYRTQYGDLARHYKLLERENAKARSVLVETQDKALRRISELREQCSLEQSAKAHLEKALRVEIEERNMKINSLNTKIEFLQENTKISNIEDAKHVNHNEIIDQAVTENQNEVQLINLTSEIDIKQSKIETDELAILNNKIEKMEQLINKYKESLKASKEKNSQMTAEVQILSSELENKNKENHELKAITDRYSETQLKVQELSNLNEELQNKINAFDFAKSKELSTLEIDLQKAQETISQLQSKIDIFVKREEDYAISLAENKLSIHKELEEKETEIKSLKNSLSAAKNELQTVDNQINDYKNNISLLEETNSKHIDDKNELNSSKKIIMDMETQIQELTKKYHGLEQLKTKADEESKCLQLQIKQETAEKLAMIDRNVYLENRNSQLKEENAKKSTQMGILDSELKQIKKEIDDLRTQHSGDHEKEQLLEELNMWKSKYEKFEHEIQEERDELVKLQSEIEKLLENHELIQKQNTEYNVNLSTLKSENILLHEQVANYNKVKSVCNKLASKVSTLKEVLHFTSEETKLLKEVNKNMVSAIMENINISLNQFIQREIETSNNKYNELEVKYNALQTNLEKTGEQMVAKSKELNSLQEHTNNLNSTIQGLELEKKQLNEKVTFIQSEFQECEKKYQELLSSIELERSKYLDVAKNLSAVENDKQVLIETVKHLENKISLLNTELSELQEKQKELINDRTKEINDYNEKENFHQKQVENISILTQENILLKDQVHTSLQNTKILEIEINEVRKSHAEMELEKDRLTEIIDKIESEKLVMKLDESSQTDAIDEILEKDKIQVQENVINVLDEKTKANVDNHEMSENYITMKAEYDILKDENRRLQSDIEGLQSYLTKISKENSELNDKIRELIATSEHSSETGDFEELKTEVLMGKEKIDDLLRENTLLVEENLELKDQLHLQNYTQSNENKSLETGFENAALNLKYKHLSEANSTLEKRLQDLEHINRSVNGNLQETYEKNEKLKLSNEKLERRLDEALVSLRHLHSLQENTELEYLRNILYEYLTGSGSHSVTLAKVLSAIVKFDDMQTQLVLQKEKERQGFLRQLGII